MSKIAKCYAIFLRFFCFLHNAQKTTAFLLDLTFAILFVDNFTDYIIFDNCFMVWWINKS